MSISETLVEHVVQAVRADARASNAATHADRDIFRNNAKYHADMARFYHWLNTEGATHRP